MNISPVCGVARKVVAHNRLFVEFLGDAESYASAITAATSSRRYFEKQPTYQIRGKAKSILWDWGNVFITYKLQVVS
jgi:hypothetical protein